MMSYILNSGICPGVYLAGIRVPASDIYALARYCDAYICVENASLASQRGNEKHYPLSNTGKTMFL